MTHKIRYVSYPPKPSEAPTEVEVPIEGEEAKTRRGRPPKATKEAEKQAKRALVEEEALVEENLVEILARGRKDLRNKNFLIILIV